MQTNTEELLPKFSSPKCHSWDPEKKGPPDYCHLNMMKTLETYIFNFALAVTNTPRYINAISQAERHFQRREMRFIDPVAGLSAVVLNLRRAHLTGVI